MQQQRGQIRAMGSTHTHTHTLPTRVLRSITDVQTQTVRGRPVRVRSNDNVRNVAVRARDNMRTQSPPLPLQNEDAHMVEDDDQHRDPQQRLSNWIVQR